jgi:hypothetical protein
MIWGCTGTGRLFLQRFDGGVAQLDERPRTLDELVLGSALLLQVRVTFSESSTLVLDRLVALELVQKGFETAHVLVLCLVGGQRLRSDVVPLRPQRAVLWHYSH